MARANTGNWSQQFGKPSALNWLQSEHPHATEGRKSPAATPAEGGKKPPRRAMAMLTLFRKDPGAQTPTKTRSPADTKDEPSPLEQPPSTGRTTALGRKVEKPGNDAASGPSGQKERVNHDRKHANK